jgi:F0F1-type ATP synthase assembly protein I
MNSEKTPMQTSDPVLVRFTEALTDTPDAKQADGIADMLLIFLSAGGTIIGVFLGAILYLFFTASRAHTIPWMFLLLLCVGAGGVLGCLTVMAILNAKDLIAWETRDRSS